MREGCGERRTETGSLRSLRAAAETSGVLTEFSLHLFFFFPMAVFGAYIFHEAFYNSASPYSLPFLEYLTEMHFTLNVKGRTYISWLSLRDLEALVLCLLACKSWCIYSVFYQHLLRTSCKVGTVLDTGDNKVK